MAAWWEQFEHLLPKLSREFQKKIEEVSGKNPLLLRGVLRALSPRKDYQIEPEAVFEVEDTLGSTTAAESLAIVRDSELWIFLWESMEWKETKERLYQFADQHWISSNRKRCYPLLCCQILLLLRL